MKKFLLSIAVLINLPHMGISQCNTSNATSCVCAQSGLTNCDLLPDIIVGKPPLLVGGNYGVIEYAQTGNGSNNGRLRISVSTPNIGFGPLEVRTTTTYICGTDTFTGTAPAICPDGITYPKQLINQRVYHKNGNVMSYTDRPAGTMTYHPTHGHMHVDDWGKYSLRSATSNPDPLTWPIVASGAKLAFCLMDYGTCSYYNGHCVDSAGNTLTNSSFPNYGLGGGNYNCSPVVQGISSGYTDIYYQYLDGMFISIPPGVCNGSYYIVVQLDPYNYFWESNENNNVLAIPYTLTKQTALPTITTSANSTICQGTSTTVTASGASSYTWLPATGLNSTSGNSVIATPSNTTSYTVTGTAANGCTKTKSVTVTVNAQPVLTLTPSAAICSGQSYSLQVGGANSYSWAPSSGLSGTTGASVSASPVSTTTYTVTGTGANGCTATATVTVTVNPYPVVTAGPPAILCEGSMSVISANGAADYSWSPASGLNTTSGNTVNASPATTTTYTVTGTTNGCSTSQSVTITINGVPVVLASPSSVLCSGQSAILQSSGAVSYSWQPASGLNATIGNTVTASPSGTTTYTITGTGANGCTATAQTTITVNMTPSITVSSNVAYCTGGTAQLEASGADDFTWQPATGLDVTTGTTVNANPVSTTIYTVVGTSNGCMDTNTVTVTVNNNPLVSITGLATSYFDNDPDVTMTGTPPGGTFSGTGVTGNVFSPSSAGVGGPYMISYSFTDGNGCIGITSEPVQVNQHVTNCGIPTQYQASNISPFSATVNWGPDVSALQFQIKYRKVGSVTYKWKTVSGVPTVTSAILTKLLPNTTYECWVKCYCATPTQLSNKITFTTGSYPYSCIIPFNLQTTGITSTSAVASWDPSASGDSVQLKFTKASGTPSYKYKKSATNTSFINLVNLKPGTAYNWFVQVYCNGTTSGYSSMSTFTTQTIRLSDETEAGDETKISVFPNPASDKVHVVFSSSTKTEGIIKIMDLTGRMVYFRKVDVINGDNLAEINLEKFNKGIYSLSLEREGTIKYIKISIN